jgi:hypothetical protein
MGIKTTRGYRVLSKIPTQSLDLYIKSFTSGSGETILLGKSDTLDTTITRGTRTSDGEGNALQIQGGQATGTNQVGGDVNIYTGYPTGNAAAGDFKVFGALSKGSSGTSVNPSNSTMLSVSGDTGNVVINGSLTVGSTEVINSSAQVLASAIPTGSINISSFNNDSGFTANTGDITRVKIIGDSGGPTSHDSGPADLTFTGGEGVSTTISSSTVTTAVKQMVVTTHNFQMANTTGTFFYVPFNNLNESSVASTAEYWTRTVTPYPGTIKKIAVRSHTSLGTSCELRISKITDTTDALTSGTHVDNTSIDISSANVSVIETMNTNSFAAGDVVGIALKRSAGSSARVVVTIVWQYTV